VIPSDRSGGGWSGDWDAQDRVTETGARTSMSNLLRQFPHPLLLPVPWRFGKSAPAVPLTGKNKLFLILFPRGIHMNRYNP
jgi:hypothetical protein